MIEFNPGAAVLACIEDCGATYELVGATPASAPHPIQLAYREDCGWTWCAHAPEVRKVDMATALLMYHNPPPVFMGKSYSMSDYIATLHVVFGAPMYYLFDYLRGKNPEGKVMHDSLVALSVQHQQMAAIRAKLRIEAFTSNSIPLGDSHGHYNRPGGTAS